MAPRVDHLGLPEIRPIPVPWSYKVMQYIKRHNYLICSISVCFVAGSVAIAPLPYVNDAVARLPGAPFQELGVTTAPDFGKSLKLIVDRAEQLEKAATAQHELAKVDHWRDFDWGKYGFPTSDLQYLERSTLHHEELVLYAKSTAGKYQATMNSLLPMLSKILEACDNNLSTTLYPTQWSRIGLSFSTDVTETVHNCYANALGELQDAGQAADSMALAATAVVQHSKDVVVPAKRSAFDQMLSCGRKGGRGCRLEEVVPDVRASVIGITRQIEEMRLAGIELLEVASVHQHRLHILLDYTKAQSSGWKTAGPQDLLEWMREVLPPREQVRRLQHIFATMLGAPW